MMRESDAQEVYRLLDHAASDMLAVLSLLYDAGKGYGWAYEVCQRIAAELDTVDVDVRRTRLHLRREARLRVRQ